MPALVHMNEKNTSPSSNMSEDEIKERIISALQYQYDGVDGQEKLHAINLEIVARLKQGNLQLSY